MKLKRFKSIITVVVVVLMTGGTSQAKVASLKDFSIALCDLERKGRETTLYLAITKISETQPNFVLQVPKTKEKYESQLIQVPIALIDDHENRYDGRLRIDLNYEYGGGFLINYLPKGFTYVDTVRIRMPKIAPIEKVEIGDEEIIFEKAKFAKPKFLKDFGKFAGIKDKKVQVGKWLSFTVKEKIIPAGKIWKLPLIIENEEYNPLSIDMMYGVQLYDGRICWHTESSEVEGCSKRSEEIKITNAQYHNHTDEFTHPMVLLAIGTEKSTKETSMRIFPLSLDEFPILVGEGTKETQKTFLDAYNRNGGREIMGDPINSPHWFTGHDKPKDENDVIIQEFPAVSDFAKSAVIWDKQGDAKQAFVMHDKLWNTYQKLGGPYRKLKPDTLLGAPTSDGVVGISSVGTEGIYCTFKTGTMNHILTGSLKDKTFVVVGKIHQKWREKGFIGGPLGFPQGNERFTSSGAVGFDTEGWIQNFEGGCICYHDSGKYMDQVFEIHGSVGMKYISIGATNSWIGFPVSDTGAVTRCEAGYIFTAQNQIQVFPSKRPKWMHESPMGSKFLAVRNGNVYLTGGTDVVALDGETGEQVWSFGVLGSVSSYPKVVSGLVLLTAGKSVLYALDSHIGQLKWQQSGKNLSNPTVAGNIVFVQCADELLALDLATGKQKWSRSAKGTPSAHNNSVYVSHGWVKPHWLGWLAEAGVSLEAINSSDGSTRWKKEETIKRKTEKGEDIKFKDFKSVWNAMPDDETVYWFSDLHNDILALDVATGEPRWRYSVRSDWRFVDLGATAYFLVTSRGVYALNKATGEVKWQWENGDFKEHASKLISDVLYVSTESEVLGLNATTGALTFRFPVQGGATIDSAGSILYLLSSNYILAVEIAQKE